MKNTFPTYMEAFTESKRTPKGVRSLTSHYDSSGFMRCYKWFKEQIQENETN